MKTKRSLLLVMILVLPVFTIVNYAQSQIIQEAPQGLVGRWDFSQKLGKDLSGNGNDADVGTAAFLDLGKNKFALEFQPGTTPVSILIKDGENNPLTIPFGTISVWVNSSVSDLSSELVAYNNGAMTIRTYRGFLQPRLKGENNFNYSGGVLNDRWCEYVLREDAFYPHERGWLTDNTWHLFTVSYDPDKKMLAGWRDGEKIMDIDLSDSDAEALRTRGLKTIKLGTGFVGYIGEISIYNTVLTDIDVKRLFSETKDIYVYRKDRLAPPPEKKLDVYRYDPKDEPMYSAWLRYPVRKSTKTITDVFRQIVVQTDDVTVQNAARELSFAMNRLFGIMLPVGKDDKAVGNVLLGTPDTSPLIKDMQKELGLDRVRNDGFVLKKMTFKKKTYLVVAANEPAGVIFGMFELIRQLQTDQDIAGLDLISNPNVRIRIVGHWSWMRGNESDDWRGGEINETNREANRYNSIYSWEDLRTDNTKSIEDWARLCASVGWNAICPTEINWQEENNFLNHLDEVETLAGIFRKYGIKLYWAPNHLLALDPNTAKQLYERVPNFGGYLLKLGSEAQSGNPFPKMVNSIAQTLKPYGGTALVRGFVYGKLRYAHLTEVFRNTMPYDIFVPNDGKYDENVIIIGKSSPLDWDLAAPISSMDGALQRTAYGTEMVITKSWPASWVGKWKWWFDFDNYRNGEGSYNKNCIQCLLGVTMISPSPAWTSNPLNMVNYYGLGRLSWDPDLLIDSIYDDWIIQTYGNDPELRPTVKKIIYISNDYLKNQYIYRGYRGVWLEGQDVRAKTPHRMTAEGIGIIDDAAQKKVIGQYAPELQKRWSNRLETEEFLPYFHFAKWDDMLSNGKTVLQDFCDGLDQAISDAETMYALWDSLENQIDGRTFEYAKDNFREAIRTAERSREIYHALLDLKICDRK